MNTVQLHYMKIAKIQQYDIALLELTSICSVADYVRTFTLDKRLEMYLKKTAGRVLPTVVYPELYRKRFCDAMERYFTVVPDKWTGLGADVKFFQ